MKHGNQQDFTGLADIHVCLAGVDRLPGEPKGCARAPKKPNGDEQDPEASQRWNRPDQMITVICMRRSSVFICISLV